MGTLSRGWYPQPPSATFAQDFAGGLAVGRTAGDGAGGIRQSRIKRLGEAVKRAGGDLSALDPSLYSDPEGMMALGVFLDGYTSTREGLLKAREAHEKVAERQFQMFSEGIARLERQRHDLAALAAGLERLSRHLNLPYNVRVAGDGNLEVLYQGRTGDRPTGRRLTPLEALDGAKDLVRHPEAFHRLYAWNALAIMAGNNAYRRDPSTWQYARGDDGRAITLIPHKQPRPEGGIEVGHVVLEEGRPARFATVGELAERYGLPPEAWGQAERSGEPGGAGAGHRNGAAESLGAEGGHTFSSGEGAWPV